MRMCVYVCVTVYCMYVTGRMCVCIWNVCVCDVCVCMCVYVSVVCEYGMVCSVSCGMYMFSCSVEQVCV